MVNLMKDSAIQWIENIPQDWNTIKIGSIYSERRTKVNDVDYPPLSVTKRGVLPQLENVAKSDDSENRKLVKTNDFVINSRSDRKGSCGISSLDGSVSLINTVLIPKLNMNNVFYNFVFKSEQFSDEFYKWGHGIVADLWTTKWSDMKNIYVPYPPVQTQKKIADYLDDKCRKIDQAIEGQKKIIEKLKEYKQSVITEAVTKGLDPNVPMKDSGVEWIGQIPEHWEIKRFKFIADRFYKGTGITKEEVFEDGDIPCVRYGEIYSKYNNSFDECFSRTYLEKIPKPQYFSYGDLLFAGTGELVEEIGKNIVYLGNEKCLAGGDIIVVKHSFNPFFLNYALNSNSAIVQKSINKSKLKVVHISAPEIKNILVALPAREEQEKIANHLNEVSQKINLSIKQKEETIEKLTEYKKSLIYECVTGKKEIV